MLESAFQPSLETENQMTRLFPLALLTLALPVVATAQPPGGGPPGGRGPGGGNPLEMLGRLFDMADANGDGQLTKTELTVAMNRMNAQRGGGQQGFGGPPPGAGNFPAGEQARMQPGPGGPEGHGGGAPPSPGQILPDFIVQSLDLTDRQQKKLAALQSDVDKRLAGILTDEQQQLLKTPPPPPAHAEGGPPPEGQEANALFGRPQRPQ